MMSLIKKLEEFLKKENLSVVIYFRLKDGTVKLADIDNNVLPMILDLYKNKIKKEIINKEHLEFLNLSKADERKNVIYIYDFDKEREPFLSIDAVVNDEKINKFSFSNDNLENIDAIIAKIGNAGQSIYLYNKFYAVNLIKQGNTIPIIPIWKSDYRFKMFNDNVIRISGTFDILRYDNIYYIKNYEILERYYQFSDVINKQVKNNFEKIKNCKIIDNEIKLSEYLNKNLSRARKFIKIMASSMVIQNNIANNELISFVTNNPKLKDNFKINDEKTKFILNTNKNCDFFLKLLDDDFLKSELTQEQYEALAKNNF
ncbi:MAG: DUF4868 domain-containing protein [Methanosarcinales archaeon]|nr:DUF4868 domain-containing protein [Methanosarcinales archaeon]